MTRTPRRTPAVARVGQRDVGAHRPPVTRRADVDVPAEQFDALTHAAQAAAFRCRRAATATGSWLVIVSAADDREIVSVTVDCASGACLAMLASDSWVMRYSASPTAADTRSTGPSVCSVTSRPARTKSSTRRAISVDSGLGRQLHRAVVEKPDRAADVGHRLAAELFGLFERLDRIVDVAILLQPAAGRGGVQQA